MKFGTINRIIAGAGIAVFLVTSTAFGWSDPARVPPLESPSLSVPISQGFIGNIGIGTGSPMSTTTIAGNLAVGVTYISNLVKRNGAVIEGRLGIGTAAPISKLEITNGGIALGSHPVIGGWNSNISMGNTVSSLIGQSGRVVGMSVGSDGLPVFTFYQGDDAAFNFVKCATANCSTFQVNQIDDHGNSGNTGAIVIGSDGFPIVGYDYVEGGVIGARVSVCKNMNCSAFTKTTLSTEGINPSVMIRSDGLPLVFYYRKTSGARDLMVRRCGTGDCSTVSGPDVVLATNVVVGSGLQSTISAGVGYDGNPVLVYYHNAGPTTNNLRFLRCTSIDCATFTASFDIGPTDGPSGVHNSLTIGSDGLPFISMTSAIPAETHTIKCLTIDCTSRMETNIDAGESWQSVALGPDGLPNVIYYRSGGIHFVKCFNNACTERARINNAVVDVESAGSISLAIGSDGLPLIGYKSSVTGAPTLAHCGNSLCLNYWTHK